MTFFDLLRSAFATAERRYLLMLATVLPALLIVLLGTMLIGLAAWIAGAPLTASQFSVVAAALLVVSQVITLPAMARIGRDESLLHSVGAATREVHLAAVVAIPYLLALLGSVALDNAVATVAAMVFTPLALAPVLVVYAGRAYNDGGGFPLRALVGDVSRNMRVLVTGVLPAIMLLQVALVPLVGLLLGPIAAYALVQPLLVCAALAAGARIWGVPAAPPVPAERRRTNKRGPRPAVVVEAALGSAGEPVGGWFEVEAGRPLRVTVSWADGHAPDLLISNAEQQWLTSIPQPASAGCLVEVPLAPGWYFVALHQSHGLPTRAISLVLDQVDRRKRAAKAA